MCGITGFAGLRDDALLRRMCASLSHRGPDDAGHYSDDRASLAMQRLSIIDLASGHQPIANETGDIQVILNGEIYNYQSIRDELERTGHVFRTQSDTETIVHAYEEHDLAFVERLRGMFAIAIWDARRGRVILARDRIGEKPLFYWQDGQKLYFGSEIKAILHARPPRAVNPQAVAQFLAMGYTTAPNSLFADIHKLAPGEMLIWQDGEACRQRYWTRDRQGTSALGFDDAAGQLVESLRDSVLHCLKSDVEVGAFLSGGLDSSLLVALMREREARVQSFSVGYRGSAAGFNELDYARRVAQSLNTQHHELILEARSSVDLLPKIIWHYDEPHGEPTSVLVYLLCEFTRRHVKVALGGTGGDELFFGYPRHGAVRMLQWYRLCPRWIRRQVVERIVGRWPETTRGRKFAKRAKRFVEGGDRTVPDAYLGWVSLLNRETRDRLLSATIQNDADDPTGEAFLRDYLLDEGRGEVLNRVSDVDLDGYLPEYQLAYMDRMSMANGLEVRSPLCDYRLVEFAASLPAEFRLRGTQSKYILKHVATRWLDRTIVHRKKVGFDSPIGQWSKEELRPFLESFFAAEQVAKTGLLNAQAVTHLLQEHWTERRDYSLQIWSLLALETWHRMYIETGTLNAADCRFSDLRGASAATPRTAGAQRLQAYTDPPALPTNGRMIARRSGLRRWIWQRTPRRVRRTLTPVVHRIPPKHLLGKRYRRWQAYLESIEHGSREELERQQLGQLRAICKLAYERSPYYRAHFERAGLHPDRIRAFDDLCCLPTIDRDTIARDGDAMLTTPADTPGVDRVSTAGTSGQPLSFCIGADRGDIEYAHLITSWQRCGYRLGDTMAVFRGGVVGADSTGMHHDYDPLLRHHAYSVFHFSDAEMRRYVDHIVTLGPCYLHVYPSAVATLARYLRHAGIRAPGNIRGIIAESEIVYPDQRRLVEEVLGCRYFACYGHTEKVVAACECEHSSHYHVWPTYGHFELLDGDDRPIIEPGQRGEIVGTGFINKVMPFIRYRTGDYATYVGDRCDACGREHTVITDIEGHRVQEHLVARDGSQISWVSLNMHDDTFDRVRQFQFAQSQPGAATLRIVPALGFSEADERRITQRLQTKLDGRIDVRIEPCDEIRLTSRGKSIYVDQQIDLSAPATVGATDGIMT